MSEFSSIEIISTVGSSGNVILFHVWTIKKIVPDITSSKMMSLIRCLLM